MESAFHLNVHEAREVYNEMLGGNLPGEAKNHFIVKRTFEKAFQEKLMKIFYDSLKESFTIFFDLNPQYKKMNGRYSFFYRPTGKILDSRYKFFLGCDEYLYGWNIVGRVLEDLYYGSGSHFDKYWIYYTFTALKFLEGRLKTGHDILEYKNMLSFEVYFAIFGEADIPDAKADIIYQRFSRGELEFMDILLFEFRFPKNMIFLLRRQIAPCINHYLNEKIKIVIKNSFIHELQKRTKKILNHPLDKEVIHKIVHLYQNDKLPVSDDTKQMVNDLSNRTWSGRKIIEAIASMPCTGRNVKDEVFILTEDSKPISPMFRSKLMFEDKKFLTVLHLAYYKIFLKLGMGEGGAYDFICKQDRFIDFKKCDVDYHIDLFISEKSREILTRHLEKKFGDECLVKKLIRCPSIQIPYLGDDYLSGPVCVNILNRIKNNLLQTRQKTVAKYSFLDQISGASYLDSYYDYITKILTICNQELGFEMNIKNIRNIFKIILPSIYILHKNYKKVHHIKISFDSDLDEECNEFLGRVMFSIHYYFKKIDKKLSRSMEEIFDKIYRLYKIAPKKTDQIFHSIHRIMVKTLYPVGKDQTRIEFAKKNMDSIVCNQVSNLTTSIYYNETFYNL